MNCTPERGCFKQFNREAQRPRNPERKRGDRPRRSLKSFDGLRFRVPGVLSNRLESISFSRIFTSTSHLFPKYRVNSPQSVPCEVSAWNPRSITCAPTRLNWARAS